jgi:hypothetical protein
MIVCPKCGADTRVSETRAAPSGVRRRRACLSTACDGRVTTLEVPLYVGDRLTGGVVMVPREQLRRMAALLAGILQEQVGTDTEDGAK